MYPILIEFGFFKVFTYGLLVATGFLVGILLAARQGEKEGIDPKAILDLCFYILVAAIIGARLMYVVVEHRYFAQRPLEILMFWKGGLVFYGGFLAAAGTGFYYIRKLGLPAWQVADILAPSLAIGQGVGRWGCFFAGCCYGAPTDLPWGVTFTDPKSLAPLDVALHPTQIYLSLNGFLIFGILVLLRRRKAFHGQLFWAYGALYAIGRFLIEFLRADDRGFVFGDWLSTSQFIGIFVLIISVGMLVNLWRKSTIIPQA
ncbi:MAG: prolipoprotein diacylglyceryl transferase [Nitrospinaceae bacterium]